MDVNGQVPAPLTYCYRENCVLHLSSLTKADNCESARRCCGFPALEQVTNSDESCIVTTLQSEYEVNTTIKDLGMGWQPFSGFEQVTNSDSHVQ